MGSIRRLTNARMSRVGWSLAIVALAGAMALSFVFAYSSVGDQQRAAQARAVDITTRKPLSVLTATQVSKAIQGDSSKELLKDLRDHVLKDDRILRVRIFNLNGVLVFSTDVGDKIGVARVESTQFRKGSSGGVASVIIEPETAVPSGLAESSDRLYVTFAALRLQSQPRAAAVVEVDHRYAAIESAAYRLWRPIQLVIGVLILIAVFMLIASIVPRRGGRRFDVSSEDGVRPAPGFAQGGSSRVQKELQKRLETVEESLRTAEQRVAVAEREKGEIAERLASANQQLELMMATVTPAKPGKGGEEASARLATLEAERDRMAAEVERLVQELHKRGSAPAAEGSPPSGSKEAQKRAELEAALADANAKAASLESAARQFEEERKAVSAELDRAKEEIAGQKGRKPSKEADEKLAQALERAGKAEEQAKQAREETKRAEERASKSDQRGGRVAEQLAQANGRMEQLEAARAEVERRAVAAEQRVGQLEAVTKQAEDRMTQLEAGQRQAEQRAAQAEVRAREMEQERGKLSEELESVKASLAAASTAGADAERATQLAARVEELEAQRRKDVSELQRVQEALANTQHELASSTKPADQPDSSSRTLRAVEDVAEPRTEEASDDIAARLSRARRRKRAADPSDVEAPAEPAAPEEPPAPEQPAAESGGPSLRARLARAAAARHRVSGGEDEAQER